MERDPQPLDRAGGCRITRQGAPRPGSGCMATRPGTDAALRDGELTGLMAGAPRRGPKREGARVQSRLTRGGRKAGKQWPHGLSSLWRVVAARYWRGASGPWTVVGRSRWARGPTAGGATLQARSIAFGAADGLGAGTRVTSQTLRMTRVGGWREGCRLGRPGSSARLTAAERPGALA